MTNEAGEGSNTTSSPEELKVEAYFNDLLGLLTEENWTRLLERVKEAKDVLMLPESFRRLGSVLGAASYTESVPLELFETVLNVAGNHAASYADAGLRTPFHMCLMYLDRPDICKYLLLACPGLISMRDVEGLRGIDILTQKILMKEEHLRYLKDKATAKDHQSLAQCLECARLVTIHHGSERDYDLPMLHACCLARSDIPLSLVERTIRRYGADQALMRDAHGNTPLHLAASYLPAEEMDDLLPRVVRINTKAASIRNNDDKHPIDLAIHCGRGWDSGCRLLLEAHPPAILVHQANDLYHAKSIVYQLTQKSCYNMIFSILRAKPDVVLCR